MSAWTSEIADDAKALARLEPDWWGLWNRSSGATPFTSPAWSIPWWSAFSPGDLRTVAVRRDGHLVALAPVYLETGPLGRRLLPIGIGVTDYMDVLLDPEQADEAGARLVEAVGAIPDWERWELEELAPGAAALMLPCPAGCQEDVADQSACPVLAPLDEGLCSVPTRQRRKVRMSRHRIARRPDWRIDLVGSNDLPAFFDTVSTLHEVRWRERGEAGVTADPRVRRFHREAMPRLAAARFVRATVLSVEGRVMAAYYGLQHGRSAYAYLGGFDPAFAFESPGTVLLANAMETAARDGAEAFHLLRGREAYKYAWGAVDRWSRRRSFRRT